MAAVIRESGAPGRPRVLVVEDELVVARHLAAVLTRLGLEVLPLVTSAEPAERVRTARDQADLVLLDLDLGGRDGAEMLRGLSGPVVVVSAHAGAERIARLQGLDVRGFVVKPFTEAQLVASINIAMASLGEGPGSAAPPGMPEPKAERREAGIPPGFDQLSAREQEVLLELLAYRRPPQIAKRLHISQHTVRNHLKSIFGKLGVHSQVELLELVATEGEPRRS